MAAVTTKEEKAQQSSKPSYEDLEKKVGLLEAELQIAKTANAEIQNVNNDLAKDVQAIKREARADKIASIVKGAYEESKVNERIKSFVDSGLSLEEITQIIEPLKTGKTKQAGIMMQQQQEYTSSVAIKNDAVKQASVRNVPAWAQNYLDSVGGNA